MLDKLNKYITDIEKGYGWVSIQYVSNQYDFLTHREFTAFLLMLVKKGMLVDENKLKGSEESLKAIPKNAKVTNETLLNTLYWHNGLE